MQKYKFMVYSTNIVCGVNHLGVRYELVEKLSAKLRSTVFWNKIVLYIETNEHFNVNFTEIPA